MKSSAAPSPHHLFAQMLAPGDIAPDCILPGLDGNLVNLRSDSIAGAPIVIVFCPRLSKPGKEMLRCFSRHLDAFAGNGARVFAITLDRAEAMSSPALNFPLLVDRHEQVFSSFTAPLDRPSTVVLRRNHHVAGIFDGKAEAQATAILSLLEGMAWERSAVSMHVHPPVLQIPDALSREDCARLIRTFKSSGQTFITPQPVENFLNGADFKMRVVENGRMDRIDHFFFEKSTLDFLSSRLIRIAPEIYKSFQYRITKYETVRVACYQSEPHGSLHGRRDNNPPTAYRRFAMSINLNTEEYEGGELRFPEFGNQRYRPDSGTAMIFSSSLLHEALHVTRGTRYVLLAFLFGES